MIDPGVGSGLGRIAGRERDVLGAYRAGFEPESSDVARPSKIVASADPLGVAIPDGAYVLSRDATGTVLFSRDGAFRIVDDELRGAGGRPVLGFAPGSAKSVVPLRVDPYDAALGRVARPRIEADGTFGYDRTSIDPRSGERRSERVVVGRLALARFPAGTQPQRIDGVSVRAPQGVAAHVGAPGDATFPVLATHARDLGRVDIIAGLEKMNEAILSYEALRSAHHARGTAEKTALDLVK